MSKSKKIYILRVTTGQEKKVKEALEAFIESESLSESFGKIIVPMEEVAEFRAGEKRLVKKKHFPGYVFVEMDSEDELFVKISQLNVNGIKGFVKSGSDQRPQPVSPLEAERLLGNVDEVSLAKVRSDQYAVGQNVKVNEGPFKDFTGVIEEVDLESQKVKVSVMIFGRSTPVELSFFQVDVSK